MNCETSRAFLRAYLDKEITPSERAQLQTHLQSCAECRNELAQLDALQTRLRSALQHQAVHAVPAPDAWHSLETRLEPSRPLPQSLFGGTRMRKPIFAVATLSLLVIALIGVWSINAQSVSAQQILNRSAQTQQANQVNPGIQHTRTEIYFNPQAVPPPKKASGRPRTTIMESYSEPQTARSRTTVRDAQTNLLLDAFGFDGTNLYTAKHSGTDWADGVTTIYRTPQGAGVPEILKKQQGVGSDQKEVFDLMQKNPGATSVKKEIWTDGRNVYTLSQENKPATDPNLPDVEPAPVTSTLYFDANTYDLLGQKSYTVVNGQGVLFHSSRVLLNETLPAGTAVAWDMTDLQDVEIVDDPNGEYGDQLPAPITREELARRIPSAYLLKSVPEGFVMQITAPPHPRSQEPDIYLVDYRDADDNYFHIQGGISGPEKFTDTADEIYTTRGGLKLYLEAQRAAEQGFDMATVVAPDGTTFIITARLSRDRVKQFSEELVRVK